MQTRRAEEPNLTNLRVGHSRSCQLAASGPVLGNFLSVAGPKMGGPSSDVDSLIRRGTKSREGQGK
jgi:hypothetical protein